MSNALKTTSHTVLVVDSDTDFLDWTKRHLKTKTVQVIAAEDGAKALSLFQNESPDLVISELHIPSLPGMELLKKIRLTDPNAMVILVTGFPPTSCVIEAMKLGAYEFLRKETLAYELRPVVEEIMRAREEMAATQTSNAFNLASDPNNETIIGNSLAMQEVFKMIGRVARSDAPVLITGESGAGKEVVASAIHRYSQRDKGEFIAINCAAIPENLLESELFGHEKGSFTGATSQRIGRFEQCDTGSLFLDEIGDMPLPLQSKILRVLQTGEYSRLGGNLELRSRARIVTATNKNLEAEVAKGNFREDLFYRLNVVRIHLPPLRERRDDIRPLAEFFLKKITENKGPKLRFSDDAIATMESYNWPGNVRELENSIHRAAILATTNVLTPKDIPLGASVLSQFRHHHDAPQSVVPSKFKSPNQPGISPEMAAEILFQAGEADEQIELLPWLDKMFTKLAMERTEGNQAKAAKLLGVTRASLRKRLDDFSES